eukprot:scaffold36436_cov176-Amphora_coffeaeformis.AAC.10
MSSSNTNGDIEAAAVGSGDASTQMASAAPGATDDAGAATDNKKPRQIIRRRRRRREKEEKTPAVDPVLLEKVLSDSSLPSAYSFEVLKTVERILELQADHVALQMPEGLLMYATVLADIFRRLAPCCTQVSVLGDVTYGACCIDDLGAQALGANLLVHYGHSCLVPLQHTTIPCLYVFVEIQLDVPHMVDCLDATVAASEKPFVYLLGTVQFRHALVSAKGILKEKGYQHVVIPQAKPLSPGEVLGCTSPRLTQHQETDAKSTVVCFLADGRFHLESTLICNAKNGIQTFYRYDPYSKALTEEAYDHSAMHGLRQSAIQGAASAQTFGILMGTLGRQGNPAIVQRIRQSLSQHGKRHFLMLVSEITPSKLKLFGSKVDAWIQVACPRLSVDWGHFLSDKPVLSSYELFVCLEEYSWQEEYPMDFYSQAGGPWSNYYHDNRERQYQQQQKAPA